MIRREMRKEAEGLRASVVESIPFPLLMPVGTPYVQHVPRYLTQEEAQAFFGVITGLRDQALFALIYHYGLRVSEVALLARGDVDFVRGRLLVRRVKGGLWSERPLFRSTGRLLREHLRGIDARDSGPLFPGRSGPLRKRQIQALFTRYRDRAGLPRHYTCHSLRHHADFRIMPISLTEGRLSGGFGHLLSA